MKIHREGRRFLIILALVLILFNIALNAFHPNGNLLSIFIILSVLLFLFCLQFFRNPAIKIAENPRQVLAPADGTVVVIEETTEEEYFKDKRIQVSIFMSPVNKHINRNPVGGTIRFLKYHAGKYLLAWHPKASTKNERTTIVYETEKGISILVRQIAGAMARRIKCYIVENQQVTQGSEFGFIKFGSRVDLFLPLDAKLMVELRQKTIAGKTVIAEI